MKAFGPVTLSQVIEALEILGDEAQWSDILNQITKLRGGDISHYLDELNYKTTAFQVIQEHCEGYAKFNGDIRFKKVGRNRFQLVSKLSKSQSTPVAIDIEKPSQPERIKQETYRILRDTELARKIKENNGYHCQICGLMLSIGDGVPYAEAHHVMPLGAPHNGPDVGSNILCVCPNHHVLLDYGAIKLEGSKLKSIDFKYIEYHNTRIFNTELNTIHSTNFPVLERLSLGPGRA